MKVKIKLMHSNAKIPKKANDGDACYDVYAASISRRDNKVIVDLGFATEFSAEWVGRIMPRSGQTKYDWVIVNSPGNIDSKYRDTWKIVFTPIPIGVEEKVTRGLIIRKNVIEYPTFPFTVGDRVAQITFERVNEVEFEEVAELSSSERGEGFGSSGLK